MAGAQGSPGPSAQGEDPRVLHHSPADAAQAHHRAGAAPVPQAERHRGTGVRTTRHSGAGAASPTRARPLPVRVDLREHRPQRPQAVAVGAPGPGKADREGDALTTWIEFASFRRSVPLDATPHSRLLPWPAALGDRLLGGWNKLLPGAPGSRYSTPPL